MKFMIGEFYSRLEVLLNKSDLKDDEREFLEQLAEFMVFLEKDVAKILGLFMREVF